jgi:hypothetical protein
MAENSWYIKTYDNPTIKLDEISIPDYEYGTNSSGISDRRVRQSLRKGEVYPIIQLKQRHFSKDAINSFVLSVSGKDSFLPSLMVTVTDSDGTFLGRDYPLDGDLISIYVKSSVVELKPIRADFLVTDVMSNSNNPDGRGVKYSMSGVMKVPGLFGEFCQAYRDKTSWEVMRQVARELNLGFASNVSQTSDRQTWICPFDSKKTFIQQVTSRAYQDDESFFISFIDENYILNFINVNRQFSLSEKFDPAKFARFIEPTYYSETADSNSSVETTELFLSNSNALSGKNNSIDGYSLHNTTGEINNNHGYKRIVQFYDKRSKAYESQEVLPLTTENADDKLLLRGRVGEDDWKLDVKYKWLGLQTDGKVGNVHTNYHYAKIQNVQNNLHTRKMMLNCQTTMYNPNLRRYFRIPVLIVTKGDVAQMITNKREEDLTKDYSEIPDLFLSGFYVVYDITYIYEATDRRIRCEYKLMKREWELNFDATLDPEFSKRLEKS